MRYGIGKQTAARRKKTTSRKKAHTQGEMKNDPENLTGAKTKRELNESPEYARLTFPHCCPNISSLIAKT